MLSTAFSPAVGESETGNQFPSAVVSLFERANTLDTNDLFDDRSDGHLGLSNFGGGSIGLERLGDSFGFDLGRGRGLVNGLHQLNVVDIGQRQRLKHLNRQYAIRMR